MSIGARRLQRAYLGRDTLARGAYIPSEATTGPVISTWADQAGSGTGTISLNTANLQCFNTTHWGEVRHQAVGIKHTNCRFAGPDPDLFYANTISGGSCVKSYGSGYYHWSADSCLFDPWLWFTERGRAPMTDATYVAVHGVDGGDCLLRWCHIRNIEDGIHFNSGSDLGDDTGNTGYAESGFPVPAGQRFTIIDRCLIEKSFYVAGDTYRAQPNAQSDGRPHCDGVQIMVGRNLWVIGSMIGGARDSTGYMTWPNTGSPGNTGMDFANAAFMIKQEVTTYPSNDPRYVQNVLIENNFLGGGTATVNIAVANGNDLAGVAIHNNKFFARQSDWGLGVDTNGTPTSANSGYGYQHAVFGSPATDWSGNTVYGTGAPVT